MVRQVSCRFIVEGNNVRDADRRPLNRLVLAKLPIGCLQIRKINPLERLRLTDGLRIVGIAPVDVELAKEALPALSH